jgi:3-deoxy-7-phosphoheptulonate synthase
MSEFAFKRVWGPAPKYPLAQSYVRPNNEFVIIAGPCSVESKEQIELVSGHVSFNGATHLRGGVFRAGTYPPSKFGWVDEELLRAYSYAAKKFNLKNIIEILDYRDIDFISKYADCLQVGCRQMQNYTLLKEVGKTGKTIFLKRHPGSTIDEWLGAAEYVLEAGCKDLYLIERGSSTNATHVRWDLSISIIPALKAISRLPVIVDGSHGTGRRDLVAPMTLAGIAAGASGCLIETHPNPTKSLSDSDQAISLSDFSYLIKKIYKLNGAI